MIEVSLKFCTVLLNKAHFNYSHAFDIQFSQGVHSISYERSHLAEHSTIRGNYLKAYTWIDFGVSQLG